jgi:hypothetical protein
VTIEWQERLQSSETVLLSELDPGEVFRAAAYPGALFMKVVETRPYSDHRAVCIKPGGGWDLGDLAGGGWPPVVRVKLRAEVVG